MYNGKLIQSIENIDTIESTVNEAIQSVEFIKNKTHMIETTLSVPYKSLTNSLAMLEKLSLAEEIVRSINRLILYDKKLEALLRSLGEPDQQCIAIIQEMSRLLFGDIQLCKINILAPIIIKIKNLSVANPT